MNIDWTEAEEEFRLEVRTLFENNLTPDLRDAANFATSVYPDHQASMAWQAKLRQRGWAAPHWPVEYGGTEWSAAQHYIFESERVAAGAPVLSPMGISMVAHVIIAFGTADQNEWFLPRILSGEVFFCQGYSEPEAGSDLASLTTSAEADGDNLILNGAKIWTTHAPEANWMFALVRTEKAHKKQEGITFVLLPMDQPGIEVRPFTMLTGEQVQSAVFFADARVPKANVLGEIGKGWSVAKYLLEFERGSIAYAPGLKARARRIAEDARHVPGDHGGCLADDPPFAAELARVEIDVDVLEMLELRLLSEASGGQSIGAMSSVLKVAGTELAQRVTELALEAAGSRGTIYQPHATRPGGPVPLHVAPQDGTWVGEQWQALAPLRYMNERAGSIYAGSNEIQRNIIAKSILGL